MKIKIFLLMFIFLATEAQIFHPLHFYLILKSVINSYDQPPYKQMRGQELTLELNRTISALYRLNKSTNQAMKNLWLDKTLSQGVLELSFDTIAPRMLWYYLISNNEELILTKKMYFCSLHLSPPAIKFIRLNRYKFNHKEFVIALNPEFVVDKIYLFKEREMMKALKDKDMKYLTAQREFYKKTPLADESEEDAINPSKKRKCVEN